jgi:hypothetical protein
VLLGGTASGCPLHDHDDDDAEKRRDTSLYNMYTCACYLALWGRGCAS